ncbi:MAG: aminopeptidase P family protein [Acidimicrobiaceae bacterium]|nr:aminopeptidase P family protein [Acidimicrobiaceae bacterium]MYG56146.1 aminopeptidase P family protein [Acidimicrobiaceae bacterium]MYJ99866.1 aminopeptidase P family protein [Acidimicrobiaceae bacterium]
MRPLSLPPLSAHGRSERVRAAVEAKGADALVVTDLTNIRWCTGFTGSSGVFVISKDRHVLITDSRYRDQAPTQLDSSGCEAEVSINSDWVAVVAAILNKGKGLNDVNGADRTTRVALEADRIVWADQRRLSEALDAELMETVGLIAELRSVKDEAELMRIQTAAGIVDAVLEECQNRFVLGVSERGMAQMLEDGMRAAGADGPAYDTIVASGPNAALPHARAGSRRLANGDLVVVDVGALVEGYRSDMTRTFVVGSPDDRAVEIHDIVTRAQAEGVATVRAGVETGEIDRACREFIEREGYGDAFVHGTGHGVGLDIHEFPAVRRGNTAILSPGQVITVEPGIYLSGYGGVRVEDTVVVTEDGCRPLTKFPKEFVCLSSQPTI